METHWIARIFRPLSGYVQRIDKGGWWVHNNDHRDLVTVDDDKIGHVVGEEGDYYVVEHGLRKSKHLVPKTFVEEKGDCYCTTLSKQLIYDSPKVQNGDTDLRAVAQHYGLAEGFDDPMTRGYGDLLPDDPARTAEEDAVAAGVDPGRERVGARQALSDPDADRPQYDSPGLTGGDRYRDAGLRRSEE